MAKDRRWKRETTRDKLKSHRNPNLLSHYHDFSTRVFFNGGRANEYLHNLFLKAAKNGEEERIRNFLARSSRNCNVNINYKEKNTGNTAITLAASGNHIKIVRMLLNHGADVTLLNKQGQSVFDLASASTIPMLLASVERQGVSNRHLLQAAWQGNLQILRRLLSSQADLDVNCKNADGMTPLLLVTRDVNLFEKIEREVTERGYNPVEVVKELLKHKADCTVTSSDGKSPLHYIANNKGITAENMANLIIEDIDSQLELPDNSNTLPIHLASRLDNCLVLLALINGGANVNARGYLGQTPLHLAAAHGHERCSTALLDNGADVTIVDDYGNSPIDLSKDKKLKIVLKEAWTEQTSGNSIRPKRSNSAPTELVIEEEKKLDDILSSGLSPRAEKRTSPRKSSDENSTSNLPDVNRRNESQVPHPPRKSSKNIKRSHSMSKATTCLTPRPPKTSPSDSGRTKYRTQTRQISSFSANAGLRSNRQMLELPKLSVKNIEFQITSSLAQPQLSYNRYPSIQRFRLLNTDSSSMPNYNNGCTSRLLNCSSLQSTGRVKHPKSLAPILNEERIFAADSRQMNSRGALNSGDTGNLECIGEVLDLDNLPSTSSCHPTFAKIVVVNSEDRDIVQTPPSPCNENKLEHNTNDKENELNRAAETGTLYDNKKEKICHETENFRENEELDVGSFEARKKGKENKDTYPTCKENNCLENEGCDESYCYKTQTFTSSNLSGFWIPCTKNGETRAVSTDNRKSTPKNELNITNAPNKMMSDKRDDTNIKKKTKIGKEGIEVVDETRKNGKSKESSISFYVDFSEIKKEVCNARCTCGNSLASDGKSNKCEECNKLDPQKKTFWISLDGETSDGEVDDVDGVKKCVNRKKDLSDFHRFSRRAHSLPENELPLKVTHEVSSQHYINFDVEHNEQALKEKYLMVHSEDTFVILPKNRESLPSDCSENVGKERSDLDKSDLKVHSEGTLVIEESSQKNEGKSENLDVQNCNNKDGLDLNKIVNETGDCNGESPKEKERDSKVDVLGSEKIEDERECVDNKSSIVLQSLSMDNGEQDVEQGEENNSTKDMNSQSNGAELGDVVATSVSDVNALNPSDNSGPIALKTAWLSDSSVVQQPVGVQICNPFPSPVPPVSIKPKVQPAIGGNCGKTKQRKTNSGKTKRKSAAKESKKRNKDEKSITGKERNPSACKQGKKGKKGKGKKTKPTFKEISVNQSIVGEAYNGVISSGTCDLKEGMMSPDVDKVPTITVDARTTTKLLRGKFPTLSPIPESPRSPELTPRTVYSSEKVPIEQIEPLEKLIENEELKQPELRQHDIIDREVVNDNSDNDNDDNDDDDNRCMVQNIHQGKQPISPGEGDVDEVDGGIFSMLFNMFIPRSKVISSNCDSETDDNDDNNDGDNDGDDNADDNGIINGTYQNKQQQFPVDEADQHLEDMIQDILETTNHVDQDTKGIQEDHVKELHYKNTSVKLETLHSSLKQETSHSSNDELFKPDNTYSINDSNLLLSKSGLNENWKTNNEHQLDNQSNEKKDLKEKWTINYVSQMNDSSRWEFDPPDDVFVHLNDGSDVHTTQDENMTSDNDSSYISCGSSSRAVSDCSESTDSYFSSQDSFQEMTPSSRDDTTAGSVDINIHEQIHNPPGSSGSSCSRSTMRARSNSTNSELSVPSSFQTNSVGFTRSQVSSNSGSLSSTTSCGEEIQWQKGSILGKGGFGTVWLGLVNTGEMIAVKQVELDNKDEHEAEKQYEKLQEEVSLLKSLHHQNIVKYIGTCLDDSIVNIFMEYIPGGSIAQALKRFGAFVEPVFQRYTKQILSGVDYLHRKNVIHRDIKGGNIMLMPNGVIKLIDFGCAKRLCMNLSLSKSSILHSMKGTPYWMAPEVVKETSGQGTKSDIWSIGCTVYEMATGSPPWSHMAPMAAIFAIGNGSTVPQLSNSFSKSARDFTAACMTREPNARPSTKDLLWHEFITTLI